MNKNLTDITVVLDRSGSMSDCREEAENGLNHFIKEQQKLPGYAYFTLVKFDTDYEVTHKGVNIQEVGECTLEPRGMTALLDAVGRTINETGERLRNIEEDKRPGLVVFVIVTDGHENSSHEFTKQQIKEMIEKQQSEYSWQFTFLGANQDAFAEAAGIGISKVSTMTYSPDKTDAVFYAASRNVGSMRNAVANDEVVCNAYTSQENESVT
jgi:uncharacterized protein YegL